jgi:hypothetical protein
MFAGKGSAIGGRGGRPQERWTAVGALPDDELLVVVRSLLLAVDHAVDRYHGKPRRTA